MVRIGSTLQSFLEEGGIASDVGAEARKKVKPTHWLPPYRIDTYCGLNPGKQRVKGAPITTTDIRPKITCEACKGLPVEDSVS